MFGQQIKGRKSENLAITKRREDDYHRESMQAVIDENRKVGGRAHWENKSSLKIKQNAIANMAQRMVENDKVALDGRRKRLAALLAEEEEMYKVEIENKVETSGDRAKRMVAVARKLKIEREEKRKAFAQEMYNKQWREGCDDLRLIESDKFRHHCMLGVEDQLEYKRNAKVRDADFHAKWHKIEQDGMKAKIDRDENDKRDRYEFERDAAIALEEQKEANRMRRAAEKADYDREMREWLDEQELEAKIASDEQNAFNKAQIKQLHRIKDFNDQVTGARREAERMRMEQEKKDLMMKMAAHKNENEARDREKEMLRQDMFNFKTYLKRRQDEEAEEERKLEILCQEEVDKSNAKRDMQWMKEKLAREKLLAEVYEGRREQLAYKEQQREKRKEEIRLERIAVAKEQERERMLDEAEKRAAYEKERERAADLDRQVEAHRSKQNLGKLEAMKQFEAAQEAEHKFTAFLKREEKEMWNKKYEPKWYGLTKDKSWN